MNKKFIAGLALTMTMVASSCFAEVIMKAEDYKGNNIEYPQVVGVAPKAANTINKYIVKEVLSDAHKFIDKHGKDGSTAWLHTEVIRDDTQYLSLRIASASYFKGAAHPNAYMFGLVFDKQTGKRLPLSYFVEMPSVNVFEDYVRRDIFKMNSSAGVKIALSSDMHFTHISEEYTLDNNDNLVL